MRPLSFVVGFERCSIRMEKVGEREVVQKWKWAKRYLVQLVD
jgi:hypothetical protein